MKINSKNQNFYGNQNNKNSGNHSNIYVKPSLQNFSNLKRNSFKLQTKQLNSIPNPRMSLNMEHSPKLSVYMPKRTENQLPDNSTNKNLKKNKENTINIQNRKSVCLNNCVYNDSMCLNHPHVQGIFSIFMENREQLRYCRICAINLLIQQFPIKSINNSKQNLTPQENLLQQFFQCHQRACQTLEELQDKSGMKLIKKQIEEVQERYKRIFNTLQEMKREDIMKLELKKLKIFDHIAKNQSILYGIKKKIKYVIKQLANSLDCKHLAYSMKDFYYPILKTIKNELIIGRKLDVPPQNRKFESQQCQYRALCERLCQYFSERVFQLSFEEEDKELQGVGNQLQESYLHESTIKSINEGQRSIEAISFQR